MAYYVPIPLYSPFKKNILLQLRGAWALVHLSYCSNSGAARICQRGPKQGSEVSERGEGVFSPPRVGRFFENLCMKTTFLAHLMALLGGWLCEVTYTNPLFPPSFEKIFYSNQGGGGMAPCALSYSRDGGAARICQRGPKRGSPTVGRFIFKICVWKRHVLAH